jgi:hypothetical protein
MDRDEREVDGGPEGLPPLVVRQAIADVLADRLPLAADAVLVGTLGAEQLYALEEGVQQLTHEGHGPDVIAELERRLVGLASARRGVDLAGPAAEYLAGLDGEVGEPGTEVGAAVPAGTEPAEGEPVDGEPARGAIDLAAPTVAPDDPRPTVSGCPAPPRAVREPTGDCTPRGEPAGDGARSGRGARDRAPAGARRPGGTGAGGGWQTLPLDVARGRAGGGHPSWASSAGAHVRWSRAP